MEKGAEFSQRYILRFHANGGWGLVERTITPDVNELTGKPNKHAGALQEIVVAWPGRHLSTASYSLLFHAMPDGVEVADFADWKRVHEETANRILEALQVWAGEEPNKPYVNPLIRWSGSRSRRNRR